jgi:1-acyl-sn-glycerol-3-phosphate acyltransferase
MVEEFQISHQDPREQKTYQFKLTTFRRIATIALKLLFRGFTIIHASGTENLPEGGPVILVSNHLSVYDMFPIQFVLPRPLFYMAKAELHENRVLDLILRQLGSFPVKRGARDTWAIYHAAKVLAHGQVLAMFPEGTRSNKGLRTGKSGAARLAISEKCPIAPVALEGTQAMFSGFPIRQKVSIKMGELIFPEPGETVLALTDRMMFTLADMLPLELRGVYLEHPPGF